MLLYILFILPPLIFMLWAQYKVNSSYKKYSNVANMNGLTVHTGWPAAYWNTAGCPI